MGGGGGGGAQKLISFQRRKEDKDAKSIHECQNRLCAVENARITLKKECRIIFLTGTATKKMYCI